MCIFKPTLPVMLQSMMFLIVIDWTQLSEEGWRASKQPSVWDQRHDVRQSEQRICQPSAQEPIMTCHSQHPEIFNVQASRASL